MTPEFDHYAVSRVLGEGGMGLVYLARDRRTDLPVAIKVMSGREVDEDLRAGFLKENRVLAALNHRNIVRFYEITESRDGVLSIVMEYVDGVDFRAFEGRPFPELLPLMIQALTGLAYLRGQNVLHRDLSSNNIFVTLENGTRVTKILDFGVAKVLEQQAADGDAKTRTGQFLGKFSFASPEHFFPSEIDWRSDVYSLGVIFHRLLTGKPPIAVARKGNYFDWLMAHQKEHVFEVLAPAGAPPLPDALRDVVRRMLARGPDDRPRSYEEILDVADGVQRDLPRALETDPAVLRSLPPPVEGRIGSSGSGRIGSSPSSPSVPAPVADAEPSRGEASQQMRWPDLDVPSSRTERFSPPPAALRAIPPAEPPAAENRARETFSGEGPSSTELLPPPASREAMSTAPTVVSEIPEAPPEPSLWTGGAANDQPGPARSSPGLAEEKTERLDDVLEKLRQHSALELLPPLKPTLDEKPISAAPGPSRAPVPTAAPVPAAAPVPSPPPAVTPAPTPPQAPAPAPTLPPAMRAGRPRPPAAVPRSGQRLVVYGAPPPAVAAAPRAARAVPPAAPRAAAPAAPAPAPDAADLRLRRIGIALIVAAIVVLFAAVLWVLVSLLRGAPSGATRSSLAGPAAPAVAAAHGSVHPERL